MIPAHQWESFLHTFNREHQGWLVQLETYDFVTHETVVSAALPLNSIELDLEDEKNARINVVVQLDNKVIKHILFLPSRLALHSLAETGEKSLQVQTVNTETTLRFREAAPTPST